MMDSNNAPTFADDGDNSPKNVSPQPRLSLLPIIFAGQEQLIQNDVNVPAAVNDNDLNVDAIPPGTGSQHSEELVDDNAVEDGSAQSDMQVVNDDEVEVLSQQGLDDNDDVASPSSSISDRINLFNSINNGNRSDDGNEFRVSPVNSLRGRGYSKNRFPFLRNDTSPTSFSAPISPNAPLSPNGDGERKSGVALANSVPDLGASAYDNQQSGGSIFGNQQSGGPSGRGNAVPLGPRKNKNSETHLSSHFEEDQNSTSAPQHPVIVPKTQSAEPVNDQGNQASLSRESVFIFKRLDSDENSAGLTSNDNNRVSNFGRGDSNRGRGAGAFNNRGGGNFGRGDSNRGRGNLAFGNQNHASDNNQGGAHGNDNAGRGYVSSRGRGAFGDAIYNQSRANDNNPRPFGNTVRGNGYTRGANGDHRGRFANNTGQFNHQRNNQNPQAVENVEQNQNRPDRPKMTLKDYQKKFFNQEQLESIANTNRPRPNARKDWFPVDEALVAADYDEEKGVEETEDEKKITKVDLVQKDVEIEVAPLENWDDPVLEYGANDGLRLAINACRYTKPLEIQKHVVPLIYTGYHVCVTAGIATGKTAAYVIPILKKCSDEIDKDLFEPEVQYPYAIIICPTRDLVQQVERQFKKLARENATTIMSIYGHMAVAKLNDKLKGKSFNTLVMTPGKFGDKTLGLNFSKLRFLVFDEGVELLETNLYDDIQRGLVDHAAELEAKHLQFLSFTATQSSMGEEDANGFEQRFQQLVDLYGKRGAIANQPGTIACVTQKDGIIGERVTYEFEEVPAPRRCDRLVEILKREFADNSKVNRVFVFFNTRDEAFAASIPLVQKFETGVVCPFTGAYGQDYRNDSMKAFRASNKKVLFASDVCARGIDVKGADLVINFALPSKYEVFMNRAGRVGRITTGRAISFVDPKRDATFMKELFKAKAEKLDGAKFNPSFNKIYDEIVKKDDFGESTAVAAPVPKNNGDDVQSAAEAPAPNNEDGW